MVQARVEIVVVDKSPPAGAGVPGAAGSQVMLREAGSATGASQERRPAAIPTTSLPLVGATQEASPVAATEPPAGAPLLEAPEATPSSVAPDDFDFGI